MCVTEKMAEGWQNLDVAPGDVPKQRGPSHWSAYVLAGRRPSAATTWLRRAAGESGCSPLSRTTSAIDRRSEKAIAQSGLVLLGFDCRKKRHRLRKCLVSDPVPQRGTPALVGRSVFIANLLFTDDQVLDRTNKFQIDGLLPEPAPQHVARVGSQPVARLRRVGHIPSISASTSRSTTP